MATAASLDVVLRRDLPDPRLATTHAGVGEAVVRLLSSAVASDTELPRRLCELVTDLLPVSRAALFARASDGELRWLGGSGIDRSRTSNDRLAPLMAMVDGTPALVGGLIDTPLAPSGASATLLVVPVVWCGRSLGVLLADAAGAQLALRGDQLDELLVVGAEIGMALGSCTAGVQRQRESERARRLDFAREVHDSVVQQLIGAMMLLDAGGSTEEPRMACRHAVEEALSDLRQSLWRYVGNARPAASPVLEDELRAVRLQAAGTTVEDDLELLGELPRPLRAFAEHVLIEGVRNALKHAQPSRLELSVRRCDDAVVVTVRNDGVDQAARGAGLGLRLLSVDALRLGGLIDGGIDQAGMWTLAATLPAA